MEAKRTARLAAVLLILTVVSLLLIPATVQAQSEQATATPRAIVRLRTGPGTGYPAYGAVLPTDSLPVLARDASSNWLLVTSPGGRQLWLASWLVDLTVSISSLPVADADGNIQGAAPPVDTGPSYAPADPGMPLVTAIVLEDLHLREGPGTQYPSLGVMPAGTQVPVLARKPSSIWLVVRYNGTVGWAHPSWLRLSRGTEFLTRVETLADLTQGPIVTPNPPPNNIEIPQNRPQQVDARYVGQYSNIGPHLREIYLRGQQLGNYPNRFTKVGDSETDNPSFLYPFDTGYYDLTEQFAYLQPTIDRYAGSFSRDSVAMGGGYTVEVLVDPVWADPNICRFGESRLECEYRRYRPSFALILVRTFPLSSNLAAYESNVRRVIDTSIRMGVIPVMSTVPYLPQGANAFNEQQNNIVRRVANEYNVPLWDLYATTVNLPDHGINQETAHLTAPPAPAHMEAWILNEYGVTRRNLEALEVLHALTNAVH